MHTHRTNTTPSTNHPSQKETTNRTRSTTRRHHPQQHPPTSTQNVLHCKPKPPAKREPTRRTVRPSTRQYPMANNTDSTRTTGNHDPPPGHHAEIPYPDPATIHARHPGLHHHPHPALLPGTHTHAAPQEKGHYCPHPTPRALQILNRTHHRASTKSGNSRASLPPPHSTRQNTDPPVERQHRTTMATHGEPAATTNT